MPKCALKREENKKNYFIRWVRDELSDRRMRQKDLAKVISVSPSTLSSRMKNGEFRYGEMLTLIEYFRANDKDILHFMRL